MIFISYSWKDQTTVKAIQKVLDSLNINYWIDHQNLDLQECLETQIYSALKKSDCVLQIVSKSSRQSEWVNFEKKVASKLGKEIFEFSVRSDLNMHSFDKSTANIAA